MFTYAALAGGLLLIGVIIYLVIKMMVSQAKTAAKQGEIIKTLDVDNKVLIAQRDAAINSHVDAKNPEDVLGSM